MLRWKKESITVFGTARTADSARLINALTVTSYRSPRGLAISVLQPWREKGDFYNDVEE
jgi:hypothetical protein